MGVFEGDGVTKKAEINNTRVFSVTEYNILNDTAMSKKCIMWGD